MSLNYVAARLSPRSKGSSLLEYFVKTAEGVQGRTNRCEGVQETRRIGFAFRAAWNDCCTVFSVASRFYDDRRSPSRSLHVHLHPPDVDHAAPARDQLYGEGPERAAWFPMVIVLDVLEEGTGDDGEDVTSRYEVSHDRPR